MARICVSSSMEARLAASSSSALDWACPFVVGGGGSTIIVGMTASPYGFCAASALGTAATATTSSAFGGEPEPFARESRRIIFLPVITFGRAVGSRPG